MTREGFLGFDSGIALAIREKFDSRTSKNLLGGKIKLACQVSGGNWLYTVPVKSDTTESFGNAYVCTEQL